MSVYLDSSAILAHLYAEPGAIPAADLLPGATSTLTRVECLRSLDRNRLAGNLSDSSLLEKRDALYRTLRSLRILELDGPILDAAAAPASVPIRTLDAIHLATALRWRAEGDPALAFATHDRRLAAAARAYGLRVVGA